MPHHSSFLLEESPSETSPDSERSSFDIDNQVGSATDAHSSNASVGEDGATFDDLVDRLLAQPASKADCATNNDRVCLKKFPPPTPTSAFEPELVGAFWPELLAAQ